jgi:hypothetical protein
MSETPAAMTTLARHIRGLLIHIGLPESQQYLGGFDVRAEPTSVKVTWQVAPELGAEIDRTAWEVGALDARHPLVHLEDRSTDVMLEAIGELLYGLGCTVVRCPASGPEQPVAALKVLDGPDVRR